jgi:ABC-2 type transport system ATP-binding protein
MDVAVVSGLSKEFVANTAPALNNVDFVAKQGLVTGLVGPDGAGKTTLMRIMAGLLKPTSGSIQVLGADPLTHHEFLREVVGYMPQRFGLYEDLSVRENLDLYGDLKNLQGTARKETFERLLAFTDLEQIQDRRAGRLSGGMKQKLGLAFSLLGSPKLLLLDEPGVGVDPISRRELWAMVHEVIAGGMAVVWSTAYLDEAELCDRVLLLNHGTVLFRGKPPELREQVRERVFLFKDAELPPRQVLRIVRKDPASLDGVVQGRSVRILARKNATLNPAAYLNDQGATLTHTTPCFEDGFIDLLGGVHFTESPLAQAIEQHPLDGRTVIETHLLTKNYGSFCAADRISIQVKRREVFGLLGPNGAGKSTTFKMLCGLVTPTSGEALVAGVDMRRSASAARQRIGYMAQKFSLYGNLSVRNNLEFFAGVYALSGKVKEQAIQRMTSVFELEEMLKFNAGKLPLGHKQRLALACALMHGPEILFLDEPTSGVDPIARREFWNHINGVVERGVTVLVTTHFMDEAEYCDRIALISQGQMVAIGTPDELKAKVKSKLNPEPTMEAAFIELVKGNK